MNKLTWNSDDNEGVTIPNISENILSAVDSNNMPSVIYARRGKYGNIVGTDYQTRQPKQQYVRTDLLAALVRGKSNERVLLTKEDRAHYEDLLTGTLNMMRLLWSDNKITVFDHPRYILICHLLEREIAALTADEPGKAGQ